ncbi:MAG: hypothetical protein ACOYNZ_19420, partial [Rhodoferax sp.]
ISWVTALLLATCSSAWAYQPLITDDTGTQGSGGNQLEFAFSDDRVELGSVVYSVRVLPLTYTRGLSETLDISIGVNHTHLNSSAPGVDLVSGNGNPSLGLKWRFFENEASKTSLALKAEVGLPINREQEGLGLGSGRGYYVATAVLMQETGFGAILFNLAAAQLRYSDTLANPDISLVRASLAPVWQLNDQWKLALDMGGTRESTVEKQINIKFMEIGAVYSPSKDLDIAFGFIGRSGGESAASRGVTGGISWRFR